jgi:hypothetical protein
MQPLCKHPKALNPALFAHNHIEVLGFGYLDCFKNFVSLTQNFLARSIFISEKASFQLLLSDVNSSRHFNFKNAS